MTETFNRLFIVVSTELVSRLRREEGQSMVEYGLILAVIVATVAAATAFTGLGGKIVNAFTNGSKGLPTSTTP